MNRQSDIDRVRKQAELDASDAIGDRPVFKISMRNEKTRMPRKEKKKNQFAIDTEPGEETK